MGHILQALEPPLLPHTFLKESPVTAAWVAEGLIYHTPLSSLVLPILWPRSTQNSRLLGAHELCTVADQFISSCWGGIKGPVWVTALSTEPRTLCESHQSLQCSTLHPSQMPISVSLPYAGLMDGRGNNKKPGPCF